jgi:hypothetical protein
VYIPDNYGYYIFKDQKYYSKYDVITKAENPEHVKWIYNDAFFNSFDWKKEPTESLTDLYAARAYKLREQYDYIILMYSGGSDSFNILDTFIQNDIKLDEVVHLINYEGSKSKDSFQNKEIFTVAKPKIDNLIKEKKISTISRIIDITKREIDCFTSKTKFDFIHLINTHGSPHLQAKTKLYKEVDEWKNMVSQGKKICFLWGSEKPKIKYVQGKWFFNFIDILDGAISIADQLLGNDGPIDEVFYWSPSVESAKIVIKQSHIIKNYLSVVENKECMKNIKYKRDEEISVLYYENASLIKLGGEILKQIIYPNWNSIDTVSFKSPTGNLLSSRDEWFWKDVNDDAAKIFLNGLFHMRKTIKPPWIQDYILHAGKIYPKTVKRIYSQPYFLN